MAAYYFGRRLKTLKGLTLYEFICKRWAAEPHRFRANPLHQMPGLNIERACFSSKRAAHKFGSRPVLLKAVMANHAGTKANQPFDRGSDDIKLTRRGARI